MMKGGKIQKKKSLFVKYLYDKVKKATKQLSAPSNEKEHESKKSVDDTTVSTVSVENESTLTSTLNRVQRRKLLKGSRQRRKRNSSTNVAGQDVMYNNILVIGFNHQTKFSTELKRRIETGESSSNYLVPGRKKPVPSKEVSDAIRGHCFEKEFPETKISSISFNQLNLNTYKSTIQRQSKDKFDAIFIDYYQMTDHMWMDAIASKKLGEKIEKLLLENKCDVIVPFSNWLLQYFHSSLDVTSFEIGNFSTGNLVCLIF